MTKPPIEYEVVAGEGGGADYYRRRRDALRAARKQSNSGYDGPQLTRVARVEREVVAVFEHGKRIDQ